MANVRTGAMTFPYPLGKVFPGASFASLSAPLTQNTTPIENRADIAKADLLFNRVEIQAHPANTGNIYICTSAAVPDLTLFSNVIAVLTAGQTYSRTKEMNNTINIGAIFIGAGAATDFAIVSITQA